MSQELTWFWCSVCPLLWSYSECLWGREVGDSQGLRFPGERRVPLAQEGDSNGHQASFQTKRKGTVERGGGGLESREVIKTIHPSPYVSDVWRGKESVNNIMGGVPLSKLQSLLIYLISSWVSLLFLKELKLIRLLNISMANLFCSIGHLHAVMEGNVHNDEPKLKKYVLLIKCFVFIKCYWWSLVLMCHVCAGDTGANSGEDIQLTTTITHVDGPTEIYKMTGKGAQE